MYQQYNSSVNSSPSIPSTSSSFYYSSPVSSSDYAFNAYNHQGASVKSNESYVPSQWSNMSASDWSSYYYGNYSSYTQSPDYGSTSLASSNKSFDTSTHDLNSYNNSSYTNFATSSTNQSSPSSSANQNQVTLFCLFNLKTQVK